jgi:hypothetical protein
MSTTDRRLVSVHPAEIAGISFQIERGISSPQFVVAPQQDVERLSRIRRRRESVSAFSAKRTASLSLVKPAQPLSAVRIGRQNLLLCEQLGDFFHDHFISLGSSELLHRVPSALDLLVPDHLPALESEDLLPWASIAFWIWKMGRGLG